MKFSDSLKKTSDFSLCYEEGKSISDHFIVLYVRENGTDFNHLGISVSKKVGNSVIRHHLARLIRESYRLHEDEFRPGLDIVVIVRRSGRNASFSQIESSLLNLASLHNIIRK